MYYEFPYRLTPLPKPQLHGVETVHLLKHDGQELRLSDQHV